MAALRQVECALPEDSQCFKEESSVGSAKRSEETPGCCPGALGCQRTGAAIACPCPLTPVLGGGLRDLTHLPHLAP